MTTTTKITKADAEKILATLKARYTDAEFGTYWNSDADAPQLVENAEFFGHSFDWAIVWESGPFEWTYGASFDLSTDRVFAEPINTWALSLYRA